jgi:Ca2+-binding RTX toxin-like protein
MDAVTSGLGSIIFAGAGNDTVHGTDLEDDIFGGSGNDTLRGFDESDILNGGSGDDTFIIGSQSEVQTSSGSVGETITGGTNSSTGDTLQLGVASSGQTFTFSSNSNGSVGLSGIENLNFAEASTTFVVNSSFFNGLTNITTESGATSQTITGAFGSLSLSAVSSVSSNVTDLKAVQSGSSGVSITDANDSTGRTLHGSSFADTLVGNGGADTLVGGGAADSLQGGDGDDIFRLDANTDLVSGESVNGGSGSDTLKAGSTSLTTIDLTAATFSNMEFIDLDSSIGSGLRQTIDISNSTSFTAPIVQNFAVGSASTTDIFDWNSTLVAGNGSTTISTSSDAVLQELATIGTDLTLISSVNTTGAIEFNFSTAKIGIDFSSQSASVIVSNVEGVMNTSSALVSGGVLSAGAPNTDMLLVFYESGTSGGSTSDAVIMRYQEGASSEASFSGELSVVGILESVTDITDTNLA